MTWVCPLNASSRQPRASPRRARESVSFSNSGLCRYTVWGIVLSAWWAPCVWSLPTWRCTCRCCCFSWKKRLWSCSWSLCLRIRCPPPASQLSTSSVSLSLISSLIYNTHHLPVLLSVHSLFPLLSHVLLHLAQHCFTNPRSLTSLCSQNSKVSIEQSNSLLIALYFKAYQFLKSRRNFIQS